MKISIAIKLDESKLREYSPNPIYEYAELTEVLREYGFVHRTPLDIGFINDDATIELAQTAIADMVKRLSWLQIEGLITECSAEEIGAATDITHLLNS